MSIQRKCLLQFAFFACTAALLFNCSHKSYSSPEDYDLDRPVKMELSKALVEISGLSYYEDNETLLAISDSKRNIFELNYKNPKLRDYTDKVLPKDNDTEDLTIAGDSIYVLSSHGVIHAVPLKGSDSINTRSYNLNLQGTNDFETLYYDASAKGLVMICKNCSFEKGEHRRSAFRFDLEKYTFDSTAFFTLSTEDVKKLVKDDNAKFDPSAAAIHPINKRLYILSSAGNLLVIADTRGTVIEAYQLNPDLYPQAEGIAFAPNGDMFISNEGKYGKPTLLYLPYKTSQKKKSKK